MGPMTVAALLLTDLEGWGLQGEKRANVQMHSTDVAHLVK